MAIINGSRLIQGVLQELGVTTLSPLVQGALGARLQQAIEAGSASNFQLAAVLASNPTINAATPAGQSPGAFVASTVNRVREALSNAATEVQVVDLQSYDASSGAFNFILDFSVAGVKLAEIAGFGADDTLTVTNAPADFSLALDSSAPDSLDFAYGDLEGFSNAWGITLLEQDPQLVEALNSSAGDPVAQIGILTSTYGEDWLSGVANA